LIAAVAAALVLALTPQQQRGKQLYLTGESAAQRKVSALISADEVEVPANVVPCASCHGRNGRGKPEGGVVPSNVQWDTLMHPTATRPAYTKPLLKRAITMGLDPEGKALQIAMPRYRLTLEDMSDLVSYLELLGVDHDPGISDDAVRLGSVLPADPGEQAAVRSVLTAYYSRLGPIFGRNVVPVFTTTSGAPAARAAALQRFIDEEQPFAITSSWLLGADAEMSAVAETAHVPTIAAFAISAPADSRYVYQLLAGAKEQRDALVAAAGGKKLVTVSDAMPSLEGADMVLYLGGPSRLGVVLAACAALTPPPFVLLPAAHSSNAIASAPPALAGRILIALPSSPADITEEGNAELQALGVLPAHATACRLALASAKLLVEALRRTGRDVDRDTLVEALDGFYDVPTGLAPPVTWAAGKHTGSQNVIIVKK
jgi:ABC-type branched-subunit amino acid transport system substrate-binding protein